MEELKMSKMIPSDAYLTTNMEEFAKKWFNLF